MALRRVKLVIAEAKVAQRKEQLEAGGSERFFEGGRFIDAYRNLTGNEPILASTGQTLAELEAERGATGE